MTPSDGYSGAQSAMGQLSGDVSQELERKPTLHMATARIFALLDHMEAQLNTLGHGLARLTVTPPRHANQAGQVLRGEGTPTTRPTLELTLNTIAGRLERQNELAHELTTRLDRAI